MYYTLGCFLSIVLVQIAVGLDGELKKRTFTGSKTPRDLVTLGRRLWLTARVRNDDYGNKIVLHFQQTEQGEPTRLPVCLSACLSVSLPACLPTR